MADENEPLVASRWKRDRTRRPSRPLSQAVEEIYAARCHGVSNRQESRESIRAALLTGAIVDTPRAEWALIAEDYRCALAG